MNQCINPLHMPKEDIVIMAAQNNLGQRKVLDEWIQLINDPLPRCKRLTKSSIAHVICSLRGRPEVTVERSVTAGVVYYRFGSSE